MKVHELRAILQAMELADIATVEMTTPRFSLHLVRAPRAATVVGAGAAAPGTDAPDSATFRVVAEATGAFRSGHPLRPGALAQCDAGIAAGDVLGLILIDGALYLPVLAPRSGRVRRTLVGDGAWVEAGEELFEFEPGPIEEPRGRNP